MSGVCFAHRGLPHVVGCVQCDYTSDMRDMMFMLRSERDDLRVALATALDRLDAEGVEADWVDIVRRALLGGEAHPFDARCVCQKCGEQIARARAWERGA